MLHPVKYQINQFVEKIFRITLFKAKNILFRKSINKNITNI